MREYPSEKEKKDLEKLNAQPWMVEMLLLNPSYTCWGPYEDYMAKEGGWDSAQKLSSWSEFGPWSLDDLNECVNFYFEIQRDSSKCLQCEGSGYNPATLLIEKSFYDFDKTGSRWCDAITQDEVDALWAKKRLHQFNEKPTPEQVNEWNKNGGLGGHDAINRWILIETRAKRLGVYGLCAKCKGDGHYFTESQARLGLVLWILHPRKGCSRGVEIRNIEEKDIEPVCKWLAEAAERNARRFAPVCELKDVLTTKKEDLPILIGKCGNNCVRSYLEKRLKKL